MDCCFTTFLSTVIVLVGVTIMFAKQSKQDKADIEENKSGSTDYIHKRNELPYLVGGTSLDRFFIECVLAGYSDFSDEKKIAKAKLLADKYNLTYESGIEDLYKKGLEAHNIISGRIYEGKLDEQRNDERDKYNHSIKYAEYFGRDKKKAMLNDRKQELLKLADALDKGATFLVHSGQQKERDWATWGGIADGLAGPGAGISTALEIQAQNAQIRASNEANMRAAMPAYMTISSSAYQNRQNANAIQRQIETVNEKLLTEAPVSEIMEQLEFITPSVEVSKTGAFTVTATVKTTKEMFIYGDVPATVDGTILAHVWDGDVEIGTAKMVLPADGVYEQTGIMGMGISGADPNKSYHVTFTPYKLWLMER